MTTNEKIRQIVLEFASNEENKYILEDYLKELVRQAKKEAYTTIIQKTQSEINWL